MEIKSHICHEEINESRNKKRIMKGGGQKEKQTHKRKVMVGVSFDVETIKKKEVNDTRTNGD